MIYGTWKDVITPADACLSEFWGMVTYRHIESGIIQPDFLAVNGGNLAGGKARIDHALKSGVPKQIDDVVRTILRRFSGLQSARGRRSVYVDCPFARAWWRNYFADEMKKNDDNDAEYTRVMAVLRVSQAFWEKLVDFIVSRNPTTGYTAVRKALFWGLSELDEDKLKADVLVAKLRQLAFRSAIQEFGVFSVSEFKQIIDAEITSAF